MIGNAFAADLEAAVRAVVRDELERRAGGAGAELVTVAAYAGRRSISKSTVRAAIADGRLEAVKIGRSVRIPANAAIERPARAADEVEARALARLGVRSRTGTPRRGPNARKP